MNKGDRHFLDIVKYIEDSEFQKKQLEWNEILNEKCKVLMTFLWLEKSGNYKKLMDDYIDENTNKVVARFIERNNINGQVAAYIYYSRFEGVIQSLKVEYKDQNDEIKKLADYYLFDNQMKELNWYGGGYYYNVKIRNRKVNLYRATDYKEDKEEVKEEENKKFTRIKENISFSFDSLYKIFNNSYRTGEEHNNYFEILNKNIREESTVFKTLVELAVGQVNGSVATLPSYSKCLGVVLYKYAHGKCSLIVKESAPINEVEFNNGLIRSFHSLDELNNEQLNNVKGYSIDFSTVRTENIDNLNDWLGSLFETKKGICTFGTPILDRHVVDTHPINENDRIINLSDEEFVFLLRIYKNIVCKKGDIKSILISEQVKKVKYDILIQINNILKEMEEIIDKDINENKYEIKNSCEWREEFKSIRILLDAIEKLKDKELEEISKKLDFITIINWEKEMSYFPKFKKPKKAIDFLRKTEKRSNEPLKWLFIKYILFEIDENNEEIKGEV